MFKLNVVENSLYYYFSIIMWRQTASLYNVYDVFNLKFVQLSKNLVVYVLCCNMLMAVYFV